MLNEGEKWFEVTLRFFGDDLPLDLITSRLGITPSRAARKGELIVNHPRSGKLRSDIWKWNFTTDSSKPFEEQLEELVSLLESRQAELQDILSIPVRGELFLGFSSGNGQGGAYFSSSLLKRIGQLGLPIQLDLYPPDIDESSAS